MKQISDRRISGLKYMLAIIPVVLIMNLIFLIIVRDEVIRLSEEKFSLRSRNFSYDIATWTENILTELDIYKDIIDEEGTLSDHTFEIISSSAGKSDVYPMGIYWGDEEGNFFEASGWVPADDFLPSERNWYREGLKHQSFAFGEPYVDKMTGENCVSATAKIVLDGKVSVLAADIYLDHTSEILKDIASEDIDSAMFVSRKNRIIIGSSDPEWIGKKLGDESSPLLYRSVDSLIAEEFVGQTTIKDGITYYVNISKMDTTDWFFITFIKSGDLLSEMRSVEWIMALMSIAAISVLIVLTVIMSRKMSETFRRAKTDPLTKLLNRNSFRSSVSYAMENDPDKGLMLIFDMDNFKEVNDQLGHPEGDNALKAFAELLDSYFNRSGDITSRLGGDEFAVFMGRNMNHEEISAMLNKFMELYHKNFDEKYSAQKLSVSIGAAFASDSGGSAGELYSLADKALYKAKQSGKNTFFID